MLTDLRHHLNLLHHLIRPARGGAAGVLVVFAVLLAIATKAGLLGLPLGLILLSWFFKYAFILFDHVVRGYDEPPALDIKMLNPLDERRPLAQLLILVAVVAAVQFTAVTLSPGVAAALGVLCGVAFPASVAILGLEGNIIKAINPVALARMIAGLGLLYAAVLVIIAGALLIIRVLASVHLWLPLDLALGMFTVLAIFSSLAGALYERRDELGLETWHSPERTADKALQADVRESDNLVTEAYGQVRVGAHSKAWDILKSWLGSRGHAPEDYRWVRDRVASWPDPRYANRLTQEYVDRLLEAKRFGDALDAVRERLRVDEAFRPNSAAATLQVARLAAHGGGAPSVARILLSDFAERFAGDALIESAQSLARHLGE